MASLQDYELEEMKSYHKKYSNAVETVKDEVDLMVKTVMDASDSNTAKAVQVLVETFSQKVKTFLDIPEQLETLIGDIVKQTHRYDESMGGGN